MEKNSISIYFVKSAISRIKDQDADINKILNKCNINPILLDTPNARVSAEQFSTLWLTVAGYLNDEFFGQDSHCMKVGSFSMLCRTLIHCKTLKAALQHMLRFFNLLLDDYYSELVVEGQYSHLRITEYSTQRSPRVFGHETLLILQHGIACWLVGRRIPILLACFAYAEPIYSEEYRRMYSSELQFNQPFTALTFDADYLRLPVIQNERTASDFIQQAPTNIVLKYKNHSSFSATIRKLLRATPIAEWPDFDTVASNLNMTRSTLRRRLHEEGQPFQIIKDQLRRDQAMAALDLSNKTIIEISNDLGFAEPSAFYRAFKKWTNYSPAEYRQLTSILATEND